MSRTESNVFALHIRRSGQAKKDRHDTTIFSSNLIKQAFYFLNVLVYFSNAFKHIPDDAMLIIQDVRLSLSSTITQP